MKVFGFGQNIWKNMRGDERTKQREEEAQNFDLAPQGGFISIVKYALFMFFGYLNARLFITTVPGWEGWLTAGFALAGEGTALYCLRNFTRSTGAHKWALGLAGVAFTAFSFVHAVFSFFRLERNALTSDAVQFYCENVAFPLLFSMLTIAAISLPLLHWRARVAARQAKAQCDIERSRADLITETVTLQHKSEVEEARLEFFEDMIRIEEKYVAGVERFAAVKARGERAIQSITDPEVRTQLLQALGRITTNSQGDKQIGFAKADLDPKA
jgi:hypothetical protein